MIVAFYLPVVRHATNTTEELPTFRAGRVGRRWRTTKDPHAVRWVALARLASSEVDVPATTKVVELRCPEAFRVWGVWGAGA